MAGVAPPSDIQGKSFVPVLMGESSKDFRNAVYYHYYEFPKWHNVQPHYGIRTDRYKLIHFYYDVDVWELYDLKTDPNEMTNSYADRDKRGLVRRLKRKLAKLQKEYGDDVSLEQMREVTRKGMIEY